MNCIVTAGPTYETMDNVRRLTNFSTGRLGTELANYLTKQGHDVTLLMGEQATHCGERLAQKVVRFTTTANLLESFQVLSKENIGAIFHAAAVSDFTFGKIWLRSPNGELSEIKSGKISTRAGPLMAELVPTPKIIAHLRPFFPKAKIGGWKFEVDGDRASVIAAARKQIQDCSTDFCVANGAAYGHGFGVVTLTGDCVHVLHANELFEALAKFAAD